MPGLNEYRQNKNTISGVNPGSPSTIDLPVDRGMVKSSTFVYAEGATPTPANEATLIAAIEKLELLIDGQVFSEYDTADILKLNKFYGYGFVNGMLTQHFAQYWRRSISEAESTALVPGAHRDPKLRAYIAAGRVNPTLDHFLQTEGIGQQGRTLVANRPASTANRIVKHWSEVIDITSSGSTPTRHRYDGGGQRVRGFHFEGANITAIRLEVDEQERWYYPTIDHLNLEYQNNGFVPQADTWSIVFEGMGGNVESAFDPKYGNQPNVMDFEIYTSSEANVRLLVERYDTPPTLPNIR